ncbi:MAG TPA: orotate phosphoribosyltransferase [Thermoanaerobaculia bacterium]|nr:orotate phosphoribosyltransferase [Thermoanaerobaculia bacterium]
MEQIERLEGLSAEATEGLLAESGALERGHFELSSGRHSPAYVQCALLLEEPRRARRVGRALARLLASLRPQAVVSPALGGLVIGHEVAEALGVPFRFTERQDGVMSLRRGFRVEPGERVAVVEDVVTTGRSTREAAAAVTAAGGRVTAVGAIVDRSGGGRPFEVPFFHLLALDLPAWSAEECPLCAEGERPEKPGSRVTVPAP